MAKEAKKPLKSTKKVIKKLEPVVDVATAEIIETSPVDSKPKVIAKAGKKSAKALKEAEELKKKAERKESTQEEKSGVEIKAKVSPPRSRLQRRGKKYREVAKLIDSSKAYSLADALELAVKTNPAKFDASVDLHLNLNVDPKHADQNVRDTVVLPAGTGKTVRVAALVENELVDAAKKAGAEMVGTDELFQQLDKGVFNFDVLIATPTLMPRLGKYAKSLGPKGLMPNPKSGTVTTDVAKAVSQAKAGRVEYRVDSTGIIHLAIGKVSFGPSKLLENAQAITGNLRANKPATVKGALIGSAHVTTTMGPSITIDLNALS